MRVVTLLVLTACTIPLTGEAKSVAHMRGPYTPPPCINGLQKNANISISFNGQADSLAKAREAFDTQQKTLESEAKKLGGDGLKLTSYNHSISANNNYNYGTQTQMFNFSGNLNYQVNNEELAKKMTEQLAQSKVQFSMNVNANACQDPVVTD